MKDESSILDELVKAKENIKRKYIALKTGEANPLTKISNTTQSPSIKIKNNNDDLNEKYQQEIENRFHSIDLDKTYGPKKLSNENIILATKNGSKYKDIIRKLFSSGGRLPMKLQKNNLVYWDNPNELVDRLRLLLASKAADNTGVSNEIISILKNYLKLG
ncbi:Uncharacterized protein FWK35_00008847 [Aphis craccivora]|uniref:Uncharacterized protein n=1 Tax=Aphis craccivora TaxID=307492 RepID=A0A6G0YIY2_APHCR|nr:Uncharacterized protein FWK35_00008847 [Aphis craccivora]